MKQKSMFTTNQMAEVAILIALAVILQLVTFLMGFLNIGIGGSISISMIPLFIIIYRHRFLIGAMSGVIYGLIEMSLYVVIVAALAETTGVFIAIVFLDYIVAFGVLAIATFIFRLKMKSATYFVLGVIVGSLARYSVHVLSGVILFRDWLAVEYPDLPYLAGSMLLNAIYMGPSIAATALLGGLIFIRIRPVLATETDIK